MCLCLASFACQRRPAASERLVNTPVTPKVGSNPVSEVLASDGVADVSEPFAENDNVNQVDKIAHAFPTLTSSVRDICQRGQPTTEFRQLSSTKWACDRCPLDAGTHGMEFPNKLFELVSVGHFSAPDAVEHFIQVSDCENSGSDNVRAYLIRKVRNQYIRVASRAAFWVDYKRAHRFRAQGGRERLVGTVRDGVEGVGSTELKVLSVHGNELRERSLLVLPVRVGFLDAPGSACFDHWVDRYSTADINGDGITDLVVHTSERAGTIVQRKLNGREDVSCQYASLAQVHTFRFVFDGEDFQADEPTRKWIEDHSLPLITSMQPKSAENAQLRQGR